MFKWFRKRKIENQAEEEEFNEYDNETELLSNSLDTTKQILEISGKDWRYTDPSYISIFKELERQQNYLIKFEFIPKFQNFRNARSGLEFLYKDKSLWKSIRDSVEAEYQGACMICGKTSQENEQDPKKKHSTNTECHEVWSYNDYKGIQKLEELQPLCNQCHSIKHINRFFKDKITQDYYFLKYSEINSIEEQQAKIDYLFAHDYQKKLNDKQFKLDLSLLNNYIPSLNIDEYLDCHTDKFNSFLELEFKNNKNLEE